MELARKHGGRPSFLHAAQRALRNETCETWKTLIRAAYSHAGMPERIPGGRWSQRWCPTVQQVNDLVRDYEHFIAYQEQRSYRERDICVVREAVDVKRIERVDSNGVPRIWCILCGRWIRGGKRTKGNKPLTEEHIPPASMGGKRRVRICWKCNSGTSLLDALTAKSRATLATEQRTIEVRAFGLSPGDEIEHVPASPVVHFSFGEAAKNEWREVILSEEAAVEIENDHYNVLACTEGSGRRLGLLGPECELQFLVARFRSPRYTSSIVKGAFLLLCQALGPMAREYARWAATTRRLFTLPDSGRQQFLGEKATGGGWVEEVVPVARCPLELEREDEVGFHKGSKQWVVRVGQDVVVLPSWDPYRTDSATLKRRAEYYGDMTARGEERFARLIDELVRTRDQIIWIPKICRVRTWGAKGLVYVIMHRRREPLQDSVGDVFRLATGGEWRHFCILQQKGRRVLGASITRDAFKNDLWKRARSRRSVRIEEPPYRGLAQTSYDAKQDQQSRELPRRSYYRYHIIRV